MRRARAQRVCAADLRFVANEPLPLISFAAAADLRFGMLPPHATAEALGTIVLADDEPHLRTLVRTTLEDPRYRILEASSGTAALELARSTRPDLMVLDLMMPGMNGLEVLRRLRAEAETAEIPIVMLTATGQERDRTRALELGADAYLVKPFSPVELLRTVDTLRLRARDLRERARAAAASRAPDVAKPDEPGVATSSRPTASGSEAMLGRGIAERLAVDESQLALYARDLKHAIEAERARAAELAAANARLTLLDRLKSDFLSFISHELRTPLNALSAVGMFDPEADPADQREIVELMRDGYERLESFVARGLDYFDRLAAGRQGAGTAVVLEPLLQRIAAEAAERNDAVVEVRVSRADAAVCASGDDVERVLRLLVDNAIQFSKSPAHVVLEAIALGERTRLRAIDRGAGFPPELAEELFRPFTVADPRHHAHGSGISLALARAIVESWGGSIRAESAGPGSGAVFEIELPSRPRTAR